MELIVIMLFTLIFFIVLAYAIIMEKIKELEEMLEAITKDKSIWINELFKFIKENKIEIGCGRNENDRNY